MKKLYILFLFLFNFLSLSGKEIIQYNGKRLNISKKALILEDENKSIKEEDIARGLYDDKFKINQDNLLYLWSSNSVYYIKVDIKNLFSKNKLELYGWFGPSTLNRTDISIIYLKNGKLVKNKFTRKIDESDRKNLLNYGHASFDIMPNETKTIYIKANSILISPLILTEKENIIIEERAYFFVTNIFIGSSLLTLLIIFIFYLRLRKSYLLYYVFIFIFTYTKSALFLNFLRNYISIHFSYKIYSSSVALYIFFLVSFVIDVLRLNKKYLNIKNYLNLIKYITIGLGIAYLFNIIDYNYFIQTRGYIYLITFTLILYAAIRRQKDSWLYKAFLFSWLPQWSLYIYIYAFERFKLKIVPFDMRVEEYLEVFANLFLIAGILLYDSKNLWKNKNAVEEQEETTKVLTYADNLMQAMIALVHSYKSHFKFDKVIFFKRKIDRSNQEILYYDFCIPPILDLENRKIEEKKYFELGKYLHEATFNTYCLCDDIPNNDLYKGLIKEYKSFIALRLSFTNEELGYIMILSKNKVEYEYNEAIKDFRYKASTLVHHFKNLDYIKEKYGAIIVEETLRNFHIEVLRDAEKDISNTLQQLEQIRQISDKYIVDRDVNVRRVLSMFYDNLESLMLSLTEDLRYDPSSKTKNKIVFKYKIIEEMLKNIEDIIKRSSNKINVSILSQIEGDYELYGHIKILMSIIQYYINYLYNNIIIQNIESSIDILSKIEDGKLRIITKIKGEDLPIEQIKREYKNEVHKALLSSTRTKLELKSEENLVEIIYILDILTKDEKKKFNIKHLHYEDLQNEDSEINT